MSKVTFVVDYEDGKEPAVHAGMVIFGGNLTAVSWSDSLADKSVPVSEYLPNPREMVLLFDADGGGWLIGWRSIWYGPGQVDTGMWDWTFQVSGIESSDVNITHWAPMPETPEAQ